MIEREIGLAFYFFGEDLPTIRQMKNGGPRAPFQCAHWNLNGSARTSDREGRDSLSGLGIPLRGGNLN